MTSTAGRRLRGRAAGKRGGKRKARATAKRRARARVRASRPKAKPKRTPKANSRARRRAGAADAAPAGRTRTGAAPRAPRSAAPKPRAAKAKAAAARARARRPRRGAPPPAFPQTAGAPARSRILFEMVRARASVLAAVQGMSAATAERPLGEGKWTTRETILHLVTRDRARLREMEAALHGAAPSWTGLDPARQAQVNEEDLAPLRSVSWEDAVRLLLTTRMKLMEAVESIPEEPAAVWSVEHPLGWMFERLPGHDRHHADIIKRWRTATGA